MLYSGNVQFKIQRAGSVDLLHEFPDQISLFIEPCVP